MKKQAALSLLVLIFAAGCQPFVQAAPIAIIQTQVAIPTSTPGPASTGTPAQPPSPSRTPDTRIINFDAHNFLLRMDDLPPEGKYYLPESHWVSHLDNNEMIQQMGVEPGREYINHTGRIDGWFVYFKRGNRSQHIPEDLFDSVTVFGSIDGARLAVEQYGEMTNPEYGFTRINTGLLIGDSTRVYEWTRNGLTDYLIEFSYRNYAHKVIAYGLDEDVNRRLIEDLARLLLGRLQSAALLDS